METPGSWSGTVLVPHKDALFALATAQRSFIQQFRKEHGIVLFPCYPLWARLDAPLTGGCAQCTALEPQFAPGAKGEPGGFYFPVRLDAGDGSQRRLRIYFAHPQDGAPAMPGAPAAFSGFSVRIPAFKTGHAQFCDNAWTLTNEQWHSAKQKAGPTA